MSKTKFIAALAAAFAFMACEEMVENVQPVCDDETVTLQVNAMTQSTKSTVDTNGDQIEGVQYLLFHQNGDLEAYRQASDLSTCTFTCTKGMKSVVVIANSKTDFSSISNYDEMKEYKSDLLESTIAAPVMEGRYNVNMERSRTETILLSRHVSRIMLKSLKLDFSVDHLKDAVVKLKSIYLINLVGEKYYLNQNKESTLWYNKRMAEITDKDIIYDDCGETVLTNGTPYTTQHVFYFYPNEYRNSVDSEEWAPRATRCVVELLIDDVLYYYPISFHFVTDSNMEHDMNITITRLGVSSPDVAATSSALTTEVRVSPWTEGSAINVTF